MAGSIMKVRILGAHGLESTETRFMSVLIDGVLALDAGAISCSLSLSQQKRIKAILLTHSHADHTMGLASLSTHAFLAGATVDAYSTKETIDAPKRHVFNGVIDPEFTITPSPERPALKFHQIEAYKPQLIVGYTILAFPVHHTVPAVSYQVGSEDGKSLFYSGDTGPGLASRWEHVHPDLLILDCGMSNAWSAQSPKIGHMTPELLKPELIEFRQKKGYLPPIILVHMALVFEDEIKGEVAELAKAGCRD